MARRGTGATVCMVESSSGDKKRETGTKTTFLFVFFMKKFKSHSTRLNQIDDENNDEEDDHPPYIILLLLRANKPKFTYT